MARYYRRPQQKIAGTHVYSPFETPNGAQGIVGVLYGVTPTNYNPNGIPTNVNLYALGVDPFFLPTSSTALVINTTIRQFPFSYALALPNISTNNAEGIAVYETQDNSGNRFYNEAFITGDGNVLNVSAGTQYHRTSRLPQPRNPFNFSSDAPRTAAVY